jgi:hypothetical protein
MEKEKKAYVNVVTYVLFSHLYKKKEKKRERKTERNKRGVDS